MCLLVVDVAVLAGGTSRFPQTPSTCPLRGQEFHAFGVDSALELVGAGPAACALLLVGCGRTGAGNAADRPVAGLVQRVVRNLVDLDVGPDALLVPVGERVELPDVVPVRPLQLRRPGAAR